MKAVLLCVEVNILHFHSQLHFFLGCLFDLYALLIPSIHILCCIVYTDTVSFVSGKSFSLLFCIKQSPSVTPRSLWPDRRTWHCGPFLSPWSNKPYQSSILCMYTCCLTTHTTVKSVWWNVTAVHVHVHVTLLCCILVVNFSLHIHRWLDMRHFHSRLIFWYFHNWSAYQLIMSFLLVWVFIILSLYMEFSAASCRWLWVSLVKSHHSFCPGHLHKILSSLFSKYIVHVFISARHQSQVESYLRF